MAQSVSLKKPLVNTKKTSHNSLNQRSIVMFHSGIKSEMTKKHYSYFINEFREHYLIKNHDKLLEIDLKKLQEMLEDFVIYERSRDMSAQYIAGKISALKLFFSMNDITLNWIKLQKMIPEKKKSGGDKAYTTEQVQDLVRHCSHSFYRAIIHFMSASGVRVGSFQELKMRHLKDMPNGCKSVLAYADTRHEYHTFIHQEAVESLNDYLDSRRKKGEKITDDSWVFCSPRNCFVSSKSHTISAGICRYVNKTLNRKNINGKYEIMSSHGFRKRFDTVLKSNKSVNISLAEKLMGHSTSIPLDNSYFKPVIEQLFDEYQKAIPQLIIDEKYRLQSQIQSQQNKIGLLQDKNTEIENLQKTILQIQNNMLELQTRFS